jgi:hypothetical protein
MLRRLAQIRFQLPYGLAIDSESYFPLTYNGSLTTISLHPREERRVTSYPDRPAPPPAIGIEAWRAVATRGSPGHGSRIPIDLANQTAFLPDAAGNLPYTLATVTFQVSLRSENPRPSELRAMRTGALARLRYFLGHYAAVTGDLYIFAPGGDESHGYEVSLARNSAHTRSETSGQFRTVQLTPRPSRMGLQPAPLPGATVDALMARLATDVATPPHVELLLEARNLLRFQANPRLAVVAAEDAFEAYLESQLVQGCTASGMATLPLGPGVCTHMAPVLQAIRASSLIQEKLGEYCLLLTGVDPRTSTEYSRWRSRTYNPRNQIIQQGRTDVTVGQAQAAIDAAAAFIAYLESIF